jgi:hypothetical protein
MEGAWTGYFFSFKIVPGVLKVDGVKKGLSWALGHTSWKN